MEHVRHAGAEDVAEDAAAAAVDRRDDDDAGGVEPVVEALAGPGDRGEGEADRLEDVERQRRRPLRDVARSKAVADHHHRRRDRQRGR